MTRARSGPAPALTTPLCDLLGIRLPIIQAPMAGGWTTPELVAAVSNAGGLGMLAAARLSADQLRDGVAATRRLTDRPFGVNFLLAPPELPVPDAGPMQLVLDRFRADLGLAAGPAELTLPPSELNRQLDIVVDAGVPVVSFAMGAPGPLGAQLKTAGARVLATVTTVDEARTVVAQGCDAIVAQGAEAGGHRSTFRLEPREDPPLIGTLALVPQVVDAVRVPVIASGGIMDGRGLVAALALGALGVQLGTRFLATRESGIFPAYRDRLLAASETDTVMTRSFTGRPARGLRNRLVADLARSGTEPLPWPFQAVAANDVYREAVERGEADLVPLLAGQGLRLLTPEESAADVVEKLTHQAALVVRELSRSIASG